MWECFKNAFNSKFIFLKRSAVRYSMVWSRQDITKFLSHIVYDATSMNCANRITSQLTKQPASPAASIVNRNIAPVFMTITHSLTCHFMHPNTKCWAHAKTRTSTSPPTKHHREISMKMQQKTTNRKLYITNSCCSLKFLSAALVFSI